MISGFFIIVMMLLFFGVVAWAWSERQKPTFDRMAQLPLEEDQPHHMRGDEQ